MTLLSRLYGPDGLHRGPGNPAEDLLKFGDNLRGLFLEFVPMTVAVSILWNKTYNNGNPERSYGFGDFLFSVVVAWSIKRIGVASRVGGMT